MLEQKQYSSYRWAIQAILLVLQISMGLNFMAPTPLFTFIMDDYGIGRGLVSLLMSGLLIVVAVSLIPSGLLINSIGIKKATFIAGLFMSAGLLAPFADSFALLVIIRVIFGMGVAITMPITSAITMEWFKPNELPIINGLTESGRAIGVSIGIFMAVPIANSAGWSMTLAVYGVLPMIGAILWLIGGRVPEKSSEGDSVFSLRDNIPFILNRNTLLLALAAAGPFAVFIGYSSWLPTYYVEAQGMTMERASSILAVMPLTNALLNPVCGVLLSKMDRRKPLLIIAGGILPFLALGTFLITNPVLIVVFVICLGAVFSMFIVTFLTIPMELPGVTAGRVAIVTASVFTVGNLSAVMSPIFIGSFTDFTGSYIPAFSILSILPISLIIAGILLPETGRKTKAMN